MSTESNVYRNFAYFGLSVLVAGFLYFTDVGYVVADEPGSELDDDPMILYLVGRQYLSGTSRHMDPVEAARYFAKAAAKGYEKAEFELGKMYYSGTGVQRNYNKAADLLIHSASEDRDQGLYLIGKLYENGKGVELNLTKAFEYYKRAAERFNPQAQYRLGLFYFKGLGVKKDIGKARKWLQLAADVGIDDAQKLIRTIKHRKKARH